MGAPVEFEVKGRFEPITGYRSGGPFNLPAGYWTDDTSMAICLAESLLACNGNLDLHDQMSRYANWYNSGHNSSIGVCFDIGNGTQLAIEHFLTNRKLFGIYPESSGGNGSLMRLAPVPIVYHRASEVATIGACVLSSSPTHNCLASKLCGEFGNWMHRYLNGERQKPRVISRDVTNSGHAPESLGAAFYHFASTNSFKGAILQAVNYGDDADTVGAITGQLAGSYYGLSGIPEEWVSGLYDYKRLLNLAKELYNLSTNLY